MGSLVYREARSANGWEEGGQFDASVENEVRLMAATVPDLSLVVACYNEEPHLQRSVGEVMATLDVCRGSALFTRT